MESYTLSPEESKIFIQWMKEILKLQSKKIEKANEIRRNRQREYEKNPYRFPNDFKSSNPYLDRIPHPESCIKYYETHYCTIPEIIEQLKDLESRYDFQIEEYYKDLDEVLSRQEPDRTVEDYVNEDDIREAIEKTYYVREIVDNVIKEKVKIYQKIIYGGKEADDFKKLEIKKEDVLDHEKAEGKEENLFVFERDGYVWKIIFNGVELPAFKHINGFDYIYYLLAHPYKRIHAIDLYYRINKMQSFPDSGIEKRLLGESADQYLTGYDPKETEKARSNITRCIERAKKKILECESEYGQKVWNYLHNTIDTGNTFIFQPDNSDLQQIKWALPYAKS